MLWQLKVIAGLGYCCCAAAWVQQVVLPRRPGWARGVATLPLLACNTLAPFCFDVHEEIVSVGISAFLLFWLANFKIIGAALDRGPLCEKFTLPQATIVLCTPVTVESISGRASPRSRKPASPSFPWHVHARRSLLKATLLAGLSSVVQGWSDATGPAKVVRDLLYAWCLYLFVGTLMDGPATAMCSAVGLQIQPHFDSPYLMTSLGNFWGRRWNLTAANTLRFLVHEPILQGQLLNPGTDKAPPTRASKGRRAVALMASFAVSGLLHEGILGYFGIPRRHHGPWFAFFALQGPLCLAEAALKPLLQQRGLLPPTWLAIPATTGVLLVLADKFFYPPVLQTGLADEVLESFRRLFTAPIVALVTLLPSERP